MIVKCIYNNINEMRDVSRICPELYNEVGKNKKFSNLTLGKVYVVYGIIVKHGFSRYYIADDAYDSTSYPVAYASILFSVVDNQLSRYWNIGYLGTNADIIMTIKDWVDNIVFYENIVNGSVRELSIFSKYKELMDMEFPNPIIENYAESLGNNWLLCKKCTNSWQTTSKDGMVTCPQCSIILRNPYYVFPIGVQPAPNPH